MAKIILLFLATAWGLMAQSGALPLEGVVARGTALSNDVVMRISGLRLGGAVQQAGLEEACRKLQASGLFSAIDYRYAPGPKRGYILTLTLVDQKAPTAAVIDIPGVEEEKVWEWLKASYPNFVRRAPESDAGQQFLAREMERFVGAALEGQHLVARLEEDFRTRRMLVSYQPETLPRIEGMSFSGARAISPDELREAMAKAMGSEGYTDRHFHAYLDLNLVRAYEERGMYRVRFPTVNVTKAAGQAVNVAVTVEEGPMFLLGEVKLLGEGLPEAAMLKAAKFERGQIANWTRIEHGIWEAEKPLKRSGYFEAKSRPRRILRDEQRVMDLEIAFVRGPLYHVGQVEFVGLQPEQEAEARRRWKPKSGDPYDYAYPLEFLSDLADAVGLHVFRKKDVQVRAGAGDHVMDITLVFVKR